MTRDSHIAHEDTSSYDRLDAARTRPCARPVAAGTAHQPVRVSAEGARSEWDACTGLQRVLRHSLRTRSGRERTPTCLGVVGGNATVIGRAGDVNVKATLREHCKVIQNQRVRVPVKVGQGGGS